MPFVLSRCQFPLRLAYFMTISKAQGQTFSKVGLRMERPSFAHGQLHVALSRARRFANVNTSRFMSYFIYEVVLFCIIYHSPNHVARYLVSSTFWVGTPSKFMNSTKDLGEG